MRSGVVTPLLESVNKLVLIALVMAITGCLSRDATNQAAPRAKAGLTKRVENRIAEHIFDQAITDYTAQSPQAATRLGSGQSNSRWDPPGIHQIRANLLNHYARLLTNSVDYDALLPTNQNKYDLLMYGASSSAPPTQHENPINPVSGVQVTWPLFLINAHPSYDQSDFEDYIVRVAKFATGITALAPQVTTHKISRREAQMVLSQCDGLMDGIPFTGDSYQSVLLEDFDTKIRSSGLKTEVRTNLTTEFLKTLETAVRRGCETIRAYLENQSGEGPASHLDAAAYKAMLYRYTSTELNADEVHQLALTTARDRRLQLDVLLKESGLSADALVNDQRFTIGSSEQAIQQLLNQVSDHVFDLDMQLGRFTRRTPRTDLFIRVVESFRRQTSDKAAYFAASNANPAGTMYINPDNVRTWELFALTSASSIPGSHLIPQSRLGVMIPVPAMSEGWAIYASELPIEAGGAQAMDRIGLAVLIATNAARAAADTGIHGLHWSTTDARQYLKKTLPISDEAAGDMVTLILALPGRATAGFMGAHTMRELRDQAREQLQDKFSLPEFHDTLLAQGPLPLPVLRQNVARWMERLQTDARLD
ncbi:MAG: DUF885 domain-containing protein [Pseudomonadales bacterium]